MTALLIACVLAAALLPSTEPRGASPGTRTAFLVPVPLAGDEADFVFLAAVPAAAHGNDGVPIVLAVDPENPWVPEVADFLRRYAPARRSWIGATPPPPGPPARDLGTILAPDAPTAACALARTFAPVARRIVVCAMEERPASLAAAVLAARLDAPLFPYRGKEVPECVLAAAAELGAERALLVGGGDAACERLRRGGLVVERLAGPLEVARRLTKAGRKTDYVVVADATDADEGRVRKLSLAAVLLAAGRAGVLAPLPLETRWKVPFPTIPEGMENTLPAHRGVLDLNDYSTAFATGLDPGSGRAWLRLDRNADGLFEGAEEGPFRTGDVVALGPRRWMVDLDVEEKARGSTVWLTSPPVDEISAEVARFRLAVGGAPSHLCLVGGPEAIPMAIIDDAGGIDADLVSDLPYAQLDDDPFVELAGGRFLAESHVAGTLLACRSLAYDDLRDGGWDRAFATAEWERLLTDALEDAGLTSAGHHPGDTPIAAASPCTEVAVLAHGSHAAWTGLGGSYSSDSTVLMAPCVAESSGCSTASLDQDASHRSVALRLLRNGAVAFVGNTRRGVAQQDLFRSEFWNALLAGLTLGEANRYALNRVLVAVLEKGERRGDPFRYQLYNSAVYGDPAWSLSLPSAERARPAYTERRGRRVTVHGPSRWWHSELNALPEWGYVGTGPLTYWRAPGIGVESWWHVGEHRNQEDLLFTAEVRTRLAATGVEQIGEVPAPLGWTGKCFVDGHADGTRSLYWRVRLLDFDMTTGEERARANRVEFRLRTD